MVCLEYRAKGGQSEGSVLCGSVSGEVEEVLLCGLESEGQRKTKRRKVRIGDGSIVLKGGDESTVLKGGDESTVLKGGDGSTVWCVKRSPCNPSFFLSSTGGGSLFLYKFGVEELELVGSAKLGSSIPSFDWSPQKKGLFAFSDFRNKLHISFVTNL